jgi:hypothetical protein
MICAKTTLQIGSRRFALLFLMRKSNASETEHGSRKFTAAWLTHSLKFFSGLRSFAVRLVTVGKNVWLRNEMRGRQRTVRSLIWSEAHDCQFGAQLALELLGEDQALRGVSQRENSILSAETNGA